MAHKILIIDDDLDLCTLLSGFLKRHNYNTKSAGKGMLALKILQKEKFDLVLCDFRLPDFNGLEMLQEIKNIQANVKVIIITGYSDVNIAIKAIKRGAIDYVTKPLLQEELLALIKETLAYQSPQKPEIKPQKAVLQSNPKKIKYNLILGKAPKAKQLYEHLDLVAPTQMTVLIEGETGSGKEGIANLIHQKSNRNKGPFVATDCGALPQDIASSELFGHEKGAFTGAINARTGSFELANGGTLFLDEVGNLSYEIQVKLLRALQTRKIRKVGGSKDIEVDIRIVAATNEDLRKQVEKGNFREDLYHRINEFKLEVPALKERPEDILEFAHFFLEMAQNELDKESKGFEDEVIDLFKKYHWKGNLREMKNVVKYALLLAQKEKICKADLPKDLILNLNHQKHFQSKTDIKSMAKQAEKIAIINALNQVKSNKTKAAKILNIDRKTLYNKIKEYEIEQ